jgi:SnoaL-like domain
MRRISPVAWKWANRGTDRLALRPAAVIAWIVSDSTSASREDRLAYALDRLDIYDCLVRYARGLDRHDSDLIASAFWPDAQVNYGTSFSGPRDEFVDWANELESQNEYHAHHISTQTVDLDGDVAHVETYVLYIVRTREHVERLGSGRYLDVLERRGTEWRIRLREFLAEMGNAGSPSLVFDNPWTARGRWDRTDPSYLRPLPRRPESERRRVLH